MESRRLQHSRYGIGRSTTWVHQAVLATVSVEFLLDDGRPKLGVAAVMAVLPVASSRPESC